MTPPDSVLREFDLAGRPSRLDGGDETSVVVAGAVLKKVHDPALSRWTQAFLSLVETNTVLIPRPLPSRSGSWVVDGWTATAYVDGLRPGIGRWAEIAEAGTAFHVAIADLEVDPAPVHNRTDRWAVADRYAWDEIDLTLSSEADELVTRARAAARPPSGPPQVVHGDLTGNVWFDADDQPTVIDFSPLIRPTSHATAIVAADALLWHGAGTDVVDQLVLDQLVVDRGTLARAIIFRLVSEQLADNPRHGARLDDHRRVLEALGW